MKHQQRKQKQVGKQLLTLPHEQDKRSRKSNNSNKIKNGPSQHQNGSKRSKSKHSQRQASQTPVLVSHQIIYQQMQYYQAGDIVFAQYKGFYWPAKIITPLENYTKYKISLILLRQQKYATIDKLMDFNQENIDRNITFHQELHQDDKGEQTAMIKAIGHAQLLLKNQEREHYEKIYAKHQRIQQEIEEGFFKEELENHPFDSHLEEEHKIDRKGRKDYKKLIEFGQQKIRHQKQLKQTAKQRRLQLQKKYREALQESFSVQNEDFSIIINHPFSSENNKPQREEDFPFNEEQGKDQDFALVGKEDQKQVHQQQQRNPQEERKVVSAQSNDKQESNNAQAVSRENNFSQKELEVQHPQINQLEGNKPFQQPQEQQQSIIEQMHHQQGQINLAVAAQPFETQSIPQNHILPKSQSQSQQRVTNYIMRYSKICQTMQDHLKELDLLPNQALIKICEDILDIVFKGLTQAKQVSNQLNFIPLLKTIFQKGRISIDKIVVSKILVRSIIFVSTYEQLAEQSSFKDEYNFLRQLCREVRIRNTQLGPTRAEMEYLFNKFKFND